MPVSFFCQGIDFSIDSPQKTIAWLEQAAISEGGAIAQVDCIFCSDSFLLGLNQQYLNHSTYTDIITFDYTNMEEKGLRGDLFVSIERVRENATAFDTPFLVELHRVLVHGLLHLLGFGDKTISESGLMRRKEDLYLSLMFKVAQ